MKKFGIKRAKEMRNVAEFSKEEIKELRTINFSNENADNNNNDTNNQNTENKKDINNKDERDV